jgi:hypothetical protein
MAGKQITNPLGAFGNAADVSVSADEFKASATVAAKAVVAIGTDYRVATAATDSVPGTTLGVALEAGVAGNTIQVATSGLVKAVPVDGAVTQGLVLKRSVTTAGRLAATASPATGEKIAVALAASASNVVDVWICK